ncbi:hypothetical protein E4U48_008187 [Claviceps purpurea]|nr:hypothetical protein E4U48_008187 [Claviceps purpurea]
MQQLGSSARTSNRPGGLAHLLRPLRREAQLSRRHSRDNANMTRRSLSGTMIALPRNSGSYNPRGHTEEATTPDEPKAGKMPDATPGNTLAWVSTTEIQLLMPQAAMNIF